MRDEYAGWSYNGARALVEFLESYEEDSGEVLEFDRVALRCDYSEYRSAWDAMMQYQPDDMPTVENSEGMDLVQLSEEQEALALCWLEERTSTIQFDGGIIIANF